MISRWSDTPAKIIAWDVGGFLIAAYFVWKVDRDEGVTTGTIVAWALLAVICAAAIWLHLRRLNKALDAVSTSDGPSGAPTP